MSPEEQQPRLDALAVIVHWGKQEGTLQLAEQHLHSGAFDRVVVVANDGTTARTGNAAISWLIPPRNLGYGGACQFAADLFEADYYAFLNTDVRFVNDAARQCLDALLVADVGITAPLLLRDDGAIQSGCGTWSRLLNAPLIRNWPTQAISPCAWVTGAAMFCRQQVIKEVRFDGSYFLGYEDADLCERARTRGWMTAVVRDARGYHQGGATMTGGRAQYYTLRNRVWFARKRRTKLAAVACFLWTALALLPRVIVADTLKRRGYGLTLSAGHAVICAVAPLPPFGQALLHEPIPKQWMTW